MREKKLSIALLLGLVCAWGWFGFSQWQHHDMPSSAQHVTAKPQELPTVRTVNNLQQSALRAGAELTIYIVGAIKRPGLYRVPLDARVAEAIKQAGGARPDADLAAINLAAVIEDGMEIVVPSKQRVITSVGLSTSGQQSALQNNTTASSGAITSHSGKRSRKMKLAAGERINLNTATLVLLEELPGIGAKKAAAIMQYRVNHHLFTMIADLRHVPGIGPKLLQTISSYLTL